MIVIRVELHSAITGKVTELARMIVANQGGVGRRRDYKAWTLRGRSKEQLDKAQRRDLRTASVTREAEVKNHDAPGLHVWHLVAKALKGMKYGDQ